MTADDAGSHDAASGARLDVRLLGPVEVLLDATPVELGGPQPRAVIAHLALDLGRVVPAERLIAKLWGERPPASPLSSLHTTLSRLRRLLEPDRGPGRPPSVIVSEPPGYVLRLRREAVDVQRFRDLALDGRRQAASSMHEQALACFDAALATWRGDPLAGIGPDEVVGPIAFGLDEERLALIEDRFDAELALGRHAEAVAQLTLAVTEHPLRERLWATLAVALYRSQRQADALRAIEQARRTLIDELGLDPGPGLRELEGRILDQDPALLAVPLTPAPVIEAAPAARSSDARFVGRGDEWALMVEALDRAERGVPALVLIEGEAGIGKSAIAERLLAHAAGRGWRVALGRCVDGDLAPALWPIIELTRDIDGGASSSPSPEGGAATAVEIADSVLAAIDGSGSQPWCLFLDDLHWADHLTLEVLVLLCERLRDRRVAVIGAFRPVATVPESALHAMVGGLTRIHASQRVVLPPLREADVAEILHRTSGSAPTPEAVRIVHARAGGNPFFVGELARLFGEGGVPTDGAVPDAVRDVVRARLAPLPPLTKAVLQVAAIAGERLDLPVLIEANGLDLDSCLEALDPAIVSHTIVSGGDHELRFAHALVRDAVLADIAVLQKRRLHRAVAEAIERTRGAGVDEIETIARHRLASLPIGDTLHTALQLIEAADVARWRGAFDASDELAELALGLARQLPSGIEADAVELRALEGIVVNEGRRQTVPAGPQVAARIETIARRSGSDAARVLALYVRWWPSDVEPVAGFADLAESARQLADRTENSFARLLGYHVAGMQAFQEGRLADAGRWAEAAVAAAGCDEPGRAPGYVPAVHTPGLAGFVAQLRGDDAVADVHVLERYAAWFASRGRVDPTTSIDCGLTIGIVAGMRADPQGTRRAVAGVDVVELPKWAEHLGMSCAAIAGWAAAMLGDPQGAEQALAAIARLDAHVDVQILREPLRTFAGEALLHFDDPRALPVLELARRRSLTRGEVWWLAETLRLLSHAERRFGNATKSAALLGEAHDVAIRQGARLLVDRIEAER
jgi:DNA-binding SARP family transcriptional activator